MTWPAGADVVIGSLFSGYGGLERGVTVALLAAGARSVRVAWVSDIDPGAARILAHRYPDVPNLGDITKVDWSTVEPVHILCGGFPCQDVSCAGHRAGLRPDTRSGLWAQMAYAISVLRPRLVVAENVRGLLNAPADSDVEPCPWCLGDADGEPPMRALGAILADLADIGYDARWRGLRASDVGAPHGRFRVFVTATAADPEGVGHERAGDAWGRRPGPSDGGCDAPDPDGAGPVGVRRVDTLERDVDGRDRADGDGHQGEPTAWGPYGPAIARWAAVLGRPAPAPTETSSKGGQRLSPRFVEWMMGLPDGWVTGVPGLSRNDMLRALGNGVVPQQAAAAVSADYTDGFWEAPAREPASAA